MLLHEKATTKKVFYYVSLYLLTCKCELLIFTEYKDTFVEDANTALTLH